MSEYSYKRPLLIYHGGKWAVASKIINFFPSHKSFVDVFCGAGSITFRKPRSKNEIINDKHNEIVNLMRVVREDYYSLSQKLKKTPYAREEYYACREAATDKIEQARRTIVKSWFGIGDSLDNKTGFKVSLSQGGSTTKPWVEYTDYLHLYAARLEGVIVENLDYMELIKRYDKFDTLFYMDPPYLSDTRSKKHAYLHDWSKDDHINFLNCALNIKGKFVISGYKTRLYMDALGKPFEFSGRSQNNKKTIECIWIKDSVAELDKESE